MKTREEILDFVEREIKKSIALFDDNYPKVQAASQALNFDKVKEHERFSMIALDRKYILETLLAWEKGE